jgi:hypothetical protein
LRPNATAKAADILKRAIGPDQVPAALDALTNGPAELVPGSRPPVAALIQNPGVVNTSNAIRAASPEAGAAIEQQLADNNAARYQALQKIAGSDEEYSKAVSDRAAASSKLYRQAYVGGPDLDVANSPEMQQTWSGLLQRPAVQRAFTDARSNLANAGVDLPATNKATEPQIVQISDYAVRSLDDRIAAAQAQGSTEEVRGLQATRSALADSLGQLSPDYAAANEAYRGASGPITDMGAARTILGKFANSGNLTQAPSGSMYGLPRITLGQYSNALKAVSGGDFQPSPEVQSQLQAIQKDLQRETGQFQARSTGSNTVEKAALARALQGNVSDNAVQQIASMTGAGIGHALGPAGSAIGAEVGSWIGSLPSRNKQAVLGKLGEALADPDKMRALLTYTQGPSNRRMLAQALMRTGQFNSAQAAGARYDGQAAQ